MAREYTFQLRSCASYRRRLREYRLFDRYIFRAHEVRFFSWIISDQKEPCYRHNYFYEKQKRKDGIVNKASSSLRDQVQSTKHHSVSTKFSTSAKLPVYRYENRQDRSRRCTRRSLSTNERSSLLLTFTLYGTKNNSEYPFRTSQSDLHVQTLLFSLSSLPSSNFYKLIS